MATDAEELWPEAGWELTDEVVSTLPCCEECPACHQTHSQVVDDEAPIPAYICHDCGHIWWTKPRLPSGGPVGAAAAP